MSKTTEVQMEELKRRFDDHLKDHENIEKEQLKRDLRQDRAHQQNMEAISELTKATRGVVEAWVFANTFRKFIVWLSGFAFLGGLIAWFTNVFSTKSDGG